MSEPDDEHFGACLGEARHPPSVVMWIATVLFSALALLGVAATVRGSILGGLGLFVLFGGVASVTLGHAVNRLHVYERGMVLRGVFGKTRIGFDEITRVKTIMGGRGVRRVIATAYEASNFRYISVSTSWTMPPEAVRVLDQVARARSAA